MGVRVTLIASAPRLAENVTRYASAFPPDAAHKALLRHLTSPVRCLFLFPLSHLTDFCVTFQQRGEFIVWNLWIARHSPRSLNLLADESRAEQRERRDGGSWSGGPSSPFFSESSTEH